ncbi:MAG TPA: TOMM precursor leader peptide-binding protein [Gemmataceae bacterium]|nr:TOMM precursor leader peptide-binding protein [Gemmataceae bacterium]
MLRRPRFRPHFHVQVVPGEGVILLSDSRQTLLRGRLYELVAPWLDGRTTEELCDHLQGQASPAEVYYALAQLERKEYACEQDGAIPAGHAALWSSLKVCPTDAARRLAERPITVHALGVEGGPFVDLLKSLHVRVGDEGPPDVVLTDSYLREELQACNAEALRGGRPWLLVRPTGRQVWVGPLFRPGATACWECLAERLESNAPVLSYLQARNGRAGAVVNDLACTPATVQVALGLAANAVASWVVRGELPELDGKVQTLDLPSWKLQTHTLVRLPFCRACGPREGPAARPFRPPVLEARAKAFTSDGGHRTVQPEETLARYGHQVSPLTGAVAAVERVAAAGSAGDGILHVYVAGNNMARPHRNLAELRGDLRSMSAGKGTTDVQARASALCEGLERYSGVFRGDEPRRRARLAALGGAAVPLNDCLLFSERQFREREARNARESRFSFIPVPFDPEAEVDWSPVWSLTRREVRYLPTAFCYYDYPQPEGRPYCIGCSNGNAAGNTLEEAVLQGFLELVERDAVALWWYNRVRRPGVDLDSFGEPYLGRLRAFLGEHGREFWVIDLTADLGIPVFTSISRRTDGPPEQIVLGFGAHLEPRLALLRAVTEMNQMLTSPLLKPAGEEANGRQVDPETDHWLETATAANQPYLLPADGPARLASSYAYERADDMAEDVRACQALVERAGMEMLVLDQTRPEIGLPVAKVIVPGLRHFWARFAPGRLYDVPVRLGWLPRPLPEDELNPIPMFL